MKATLIFFNLLFVLILSAVNTSYAQVNGTDIMQKVYDQPTGNDLQGELTMILINSQGEERVRKLKQYIQNSTQEEKKIMFFLSPADVKGTSFMNWSYSNGKDDDQWIYLPALKRTKRISSEGKGDYFMGSDFTYDDLGDRNPDEDTHTLLREEQLDGKLFYVVESIPREDGNIYSRTLTWVNKDNFIGMKREYYDKNGKLLKVLTISDVQKIKGYWVILKTEMRNVQKNHSTQMLLSNLKIDTGISADKFTERSMTLGQ